MPRAVRVRLARAWDSVTAAPPRRGVSRHQTNHNPQQDETTSLEGAARLTCAHHARGAPVSVGAVLAPASHREVVPPRAGINAAANEATKGTM